MVPNSKYGSKRACAEKVVRASGTARGFARGLNRGQQQGDQDANDGNDHQEFDQRESPASG
jgi:hypothetical protein